MSVILGVLVRCCGAATNMRRRSIVAACAVERLGERLRNLVRHASDVCVVAADGRVEWMRTRSSACSMRPTA
jgi:hypothetical protein